MAQIVAVRTGTRIHRVFSQRITSPDYPVDNGDTLYGFPDWRVVYTPGHTAHDIALFHAGEKVLYCGDSIVEVNGRFKLPLPVIFKKRMRDSYREMGLLGATTILIPHGHIIRTEDSNPIFEELELLLKKPPDKIRRRVQWFSVWSPDIWKPSVRKLLTGQPRAGV
jgi:glyoxylase-like metal-dependent hydrolase (beta-lactamase superfamily II)